jgi:hypothetical protein
VWGYESSVALLTCACYRLYSKPVGRYSSVTCWWLLTATTLSVYTTDVSKASAIRRHQSGVIHRHPDRPTPPFTAPQTPYHNQPREQVEHHRTPAGHAAERWISSDYDYRGGGGGRPTLPTDNGMTGDDHGSRGSARPVLQSEWYKVLLLYSYSIVVPSRNTTVRALYINSIDSHAISYSFYSKKLIWDMGAF